MNAAEHRHPMGVADPMDGQAVTVDLATWCADRAAAYRDFEDHELPMYPDDEARDREIVEWVVRVLGNPTLAESRAVLAALVERHGSTLIAIAEAFAGPTYAQLAEGHASMLDQVDEWRREMATIVAERDVARARIAEYEHAISWNTSCTGCATILDSCYAETVRREQAEDEVVRMRPVVEAAAVWRDADSSAERGQAHARLTVAVDMYRAATKAASAPAVDALASRTGVAEGYGEDAGVPEASGAAEAVGPAEPMRSARLETLAALPTRAAEIHRQLRAAGWTDRLDLQQVIALAEEVGEFVGAFRRWAGMARRSGTFADVAAELADVVITAFVTGDVLKINLVAAITTKLDVIFTRGWREDQPATADPSVDHASHSQQWVGGCPECPKDRPAVPGA